MRAPANGAKPGCLAPISKASCMRIEELREGFVGSLYEGAVTGG